jgi:16S rRNA (cytidine1402-2'-O)-methyltransferase
MLADGKNLALVSDAGTPGISDPGLKLVSFIREKAEELAEKDGEEVSISIVPIPGPSALTTALSVAGVPISTFTFYGFLPHKKGRQTLFIEIAASERASVFYESPHRIEKTMAELLVRLAPERKVVIARELTKMFEQVVVGSAAEIVEKIKKGEIPIKGEFVVIVV